MLKCCLCGADILDGIGNNPAPLMETTEENRCCNDCNSTKVIPARLQNMSEGKDPREVKKENQEG